MTDPTGELERRVSALEQQVARLRVDLDRTRGDAEAARTLAGGADRDVSEVRSQLRAQRHLLQSLRETQIEQGERLDRSKPDGALEDRVTGLDARLTGRMDALEARAEMREGFAKIHVGMAHIVTLLERDSDE